MTTGDHRGAGVTKPRATLSRDHQDALDALAVAVVKAAADGDRPPCGQYGAAGAWTSSDPAERAVAVKACAACPVLAACAAAGQHEAAGVWGGRDLEQQRKVNR